MKNTPIMQFNSDSELQTCLEWWQKRLGLQDWIIKLEPNCLPSDLFVDDVVGETEWQEVKKVAVIRIIDEKYYGKRIVPFDFEKTLVHELLHIKLCLLDESGNDLQDRLTHQIIDDLARAFIEVKRTNKL